MTRKTDCGCYLCELGRPRRPFQPNIQQIGFNSPEFLAIRQAVLKQLGVPSGGTLLDADYGEIELRILGRTRDSQERG